MELREVFKFLLGLYFMYYCVGFVDTNESTSTKKNPLFGVLNTMNDYIKWTRVEEQIVEVLTKRLELLELENNLVESYFEDYKKSIGESIKHLKKPVHTPEGRGKFVGSSPILGHRMTSRFAGVLEKLRKLLTSPEYQTNQINVINILELAENKSSTKWVGSEDLLQSMQGILQIQVTNGYQPSEVYSSFGLENDRLERLVPRHIAEMGMFALCRDLFASSVNWFEFALNMTKTKNEMTEEDLERDLVDSLYQISVQEHNRVLANPDLKDDYDVLISLYTNPLPQEELAFHDVLHETMSDILDEKEGQFMNLCRGNTLQTPDVQAELKCYNEKRRHPYLYINPVKVEQLSKTPEILQFYDIVSDEIGQELRRDYSHEVASSQTYRIEKGSSATYEPSKLRTSVSVGLSTESTPGNVFKLADMITGLSLWDEEDWVQYSEYTYGRYYAHHPDHVSCAENGMEIDDLVRKRFGEKGNRLATILFYMEVPEKGGYTPFCEAGVFARPVKGSAIFWYNLFRSGKPRNDVTHGACPVIHGHKTIMNHWVRYNSNWQNFKCTRNPLE